MIGGVVLAGGRSSRMGSDKATLDWKGTPLVAHVAATVAAAVPGPVVVVRAPGQRLPVLPCAVVEDRHPDRGPLEGLAAGLAAIDADAAFVCATDMPLVTAAVIAELAAALRDGDDAVTAGDLPLGAIYRTRLAPLAAERAASADRSLRGLLRAVSTRRIAVADAGSLASLDTPEAYAAALRS